MFTILLWIHILSGGLALLSGFVAVISKKRRGAHSRAGNIFFYSMTISALTSIALSSMHFQPFLFAIGFFTLYLVTGGKLSLQIQRKPKLTKLWPAYAWSGLGTSLLMAYIATTLLENAFSAALILFVFAGIQTIFALNDLFYNPKTQTKSLIYQHINKMGGAYISSCTAFIVVNVDFLPAYVSWLGPTIIGTMLITWANLQRRNLRKS